MDDIKKCSKCKTNYSKSSFHKDISEKECLHPHCIFCRKQIQKEYLMKTLEKRKIYEKNRYKTDVNFRLFKNTRRRIHHALNGKSKSSSTRDILGIEIDLYRNWIEYQMTPEVNWSNIKIDHVKAICLFDISKDEELREAFNWKITQPLLKHDHQKKGTKLNILVYQLQFIKAYQFIKLNEEGLNQNLH